MSHRILAVAGAVAGLVVGTVAAAPSVTAAQRRTTYTVTSAPARASAYPHLKILHRDPHAAITPGRLFTGPKIDGARPANAPVGPMIVDDHGRPVYFLNETNPQFRATDVKEQIYHGLRVLTYWSGGNGVTGPGSGDGTDYIVDQHYRVIRKVHGHNGMPADQHEFTLTSHNTALIVGYETKTADARAEHGAADQKVVDCVVQEINLATSKVVFEWHSLKHVPLSASYQPAPPSASTPWDYFHINGVKLDDDSNVIISGRHTWAIYKVNHKTGATMFTAGGKDSTLKIGRGASFSWQHDPEPLGGHVYRVFDNASSLMPNPQGGGGTVGSQQHPQSRVITFKVDPVRKTTTNLGHIVYSGKDLSAPSQGNAAHLPANHLLIGWGAADHITEINANKQQIFDAQFSTSPNSYNTYRAFKARWQGYAPKSDLRLRFRTINSNKQGDVVWNGAGTVVRWRIYGGRTRDVKQIGSIAWNGYDTGFHLSSYPAFVQVGAIDASGHELARTPVTATT